jgi:hypothetical protein
MLSTSQYYRSSMDIETKLYSVKGSLVMVISAILLVVPTSLLCKLEFLTRSPYFNFNSGSNWNEGGGDGVQLGPRGTSTTN